MDTNSLIDQLVGDLRPSHWYDRPMLQSTALLIGLAFAALALLISLNRPDTVLTVSRPMELGQLVIGIITTGLASRAAFSCCLPVRSRVPAVLAVVGGVMWLAFSLSEVWFASPTQGWLPSDFRPALPCVGILLACAISTGTAFILMLRAGYPMAWCRAAVFSAIALALLADSMLRLILFHPAFNAPEIVTEQVGALIALTAILLGAGQKLFEVPRHRV